MVSNKLGHRFEKKLVKSKNARLTILRFEKLLRRKLQLRHELEFQLAHSD